MSQQFFKETRVKIMNNLLEEAKYSQSAYNKYVDYLKTTFKNIGYTDPTLVHYVTELRKAVNPGYESQLVSHQLDEKALESIPADFEALKTNWHFGNFVNYFSRKKFTIDHQVPSTKVVSNTKE